MHVLIIFTHLNHGINPPELIGFNRLHDGKICVGLSRAV